jgi:hypothetical protein
MDGLAACFDEDLIFCPSCDFDIEEFVNWLMESNFEKTIVPFWCPHCSVPLAVQADEYGLNVRFYEDVRQEFGELPTEWWRE